MHHAFDQLARQAAATGNRRASLKALGGAAIGAAVAQPLSAAARKRRKQRKQRCSKKRRKQCNQGKAECRFGAAEFCQRFLNERECQERLFPCCEICDAEPALLCILRATDLAPDV